MSFISLLRMPVTLQDIGDQYEVVDTLDTVGFLEPQSEQEYLVDQQTYMTTYRLFLSPGLRFPNGNRVAASSRAVVDGTTYEFKSVLVFRHPRTAAEHHIEALCVEVEG